MGRWQIPTDWAIENSISHRIKKDYQSDNIIATFFDEEGNKWEVGVDYTNAWFIEDSSVYDRHENICFYKNGELSTPTFEDMNLALDAIARPFDLSYPRFGVGDYFDDILKIYRPSCSINWQCGLSLIALSDESERKGLYKDILWEIVTSRLAPFLLESNTGSALEDGDNIYKYLPLLNMNQII